MPGDVPRAARTPAAQPGAPSGVVVTRPGGTPSSALTSPAAYAEPAIT